MHHNAAASEDRGGTAHIAVFLYGEKDRIDDVMRECVRTLFQQGLRVGGLVQASQGEGAACKVDVTDIGSGVAIPLSQSLGSGSQSCRLDLDGLAKACVLLEEAIRNQPDVLFVSRFGKEEGFGRGLIVPFARALVSGLPVVCAVHEKNLDALYRFLDGIRFRFVQSEEDVLDWMGQFHEAK